MPWMTARYYSLTLKRALSGDDLRRAVCVRSRVRHTSEGLCRESHPPHVLGPQRVNGGRGSC